MYLYVQLLHIETGWVIKGINSESAKIQTPESTSSKLNHWHALNFLEGAHQCQTDIVQAAGLFAPSLASFDETISSASGPACSLCQFSVPSIPLLSSKDIFCCDSAKLKLTLGSRIFTRCLNVPLLRLRTLALRCPTVTAHASVVYIELWLSSTGGWWYCCVWPEALSRWGCVVSYDDKGVATDEEDAPRVLRLLACLMRSNNHALLSIFCKSARNLSSLGV